MKRALFDIDGTLTQTSAIDEVCFRTAYAERLELHDISWALETCPHISDTGITRHIYQSHLSRASHDYEEAAICARVVALLAEHQRRAPTHFADVSALNVDFATGGSVKWLCGGPGVGWLYVRPDLHQQFQPKVTGWSAHRSPFAFEAEMDYAPGIHRYLHGSPAIPALYAAESGYDLINEIGVARIRAHSIKQTSRLIEMAEEQGWRVNSPRNANQRGGSVIIDVPFAGEVVQELSARDVLVDYRPGAGLRIGPHFFNTDEELATVIREIKTILDTKAYEKYLSASGATF